MPDIPETIKSLNSTPLHLLLLVIATPFLFIAVVAEVQGKVKLDTVGRIAAGVIGVLFLGSSFGLWFFVPPSPNNSPAPTPKSSTDALGSPSGAEPAERPPGAPPSTSDEVTCRHLHESLTAASSAVPEIIAGEYSVKFERGRLIMDVPKGYEATIPQYPHVVPANPRINCPNVKISVEAKVMKTSDELHIRLGCRQEPSAMAANQPKSYRLHVNVYPVAQDGTKPSEGWAWIERWDGQRSEPIGETEKVSKIRRGDASNMISLSCKDNMISAVINEGTSDEHRFSHVDHDKQPYTTGDVWFGIRSQKGPATVEFSNLRIEPL